MSNRSNNKSLFPGSLIVHCLKSVESLLDPCYTPQFGSKAAFQLQKDKHNTETDQKYTFNSKYRNFRTTTHYKYEPPNSEMSFSYEIPALDNLETQDVVFWQDTFKSLNITCSSEEQHLLAVLKRTISPLIWASMSLANKTDQLYKNFLSMVYD